MASLTKEIEHCSWSTRVIKMEKQWRQSTWTSWRINSQRSRTPSTSSSLLLAEIGLDKLKKAKVILRIKKHLSKNLIVKCWSRSRSRKKWSVQWSTMESHLFSILQCAVKRHRWLREKATKSSINSLRQSRKHHQMACTLSKLYGKTSQQIYLKAFRIKPGKKLINLIYLSLSARKLLV